jgi:hypothetical protein
MGRVAFLRPFVPYLNGVLAVLFVIAGYRFLESGLKKRSREAGLVWQKTWLADTIIGISILAAVVVCLGYCATRFSARP